MSGRFVQSSALAAYRHPVTRRFLQTRFGSATFVRAYDLYKNFIEAPGNHALARNIPAGSWVIDIGANIGFFTGRFANWTRDGGRVIAVEPDAHNVRLLQQRLARRGIKSVDVHHAAAAEFNGTIFLQHNPDHPGDHRISDKGEAVVCVTVDDIVERAGNPMIGLIKIDTQGAERRVLLGAAKTLQRCRPNLFIEVDDGALRQFDTTALELLEDLSALEYRFYRISRSGKQAAISQEEAGAALRSAKSAYLDLLCIHAGSPNLDGGFMSIEPAACLIR